MNGPNTASSLLKRRDEKPRDTDTRNEHQVRRLTPVLTITGAVSDCELYASPESLLDIATVTKGLSKRSINFPYRRGHFYPTVILLLDKKYSMKETAEHAS